MCDFLPDKKRYSNSHKNMLFLREIFETIWKPPLSRRTLHLQLTPYFWAIFSWHPSLSKFKKWEPPFPRPSFRSWWSIKKSFFLFSLYGCTLLISSLHFLEATRVRPLLSKLLVFQNFQCSKLLNVCSVLWPNKQYLSVYR